MCRSLKILSFLTGVCCLLFVSCADENTYITQGDKTPEKEPIVHPQKLVQSLGAYNFFGAGGDDHLYPSYIMQAKGLRNMYSESKFVQEYITDDLFLEMKNPGEGVKLEIILKESEINEETSNMGTVLTNEDVLNIQMPVNWKYKNLKSWRRNNLVDLTYEVKLDDKLVERYTRTFVCHSVNSVIFSILMEPDPSSDINAIIEDFGNFPWQINDEGVVYLGLGDLIAGYVDEHSPLVEELKKEVILDNYVSALNGAAAFSEEELLSSIDAYGYLMQKYRVAYGNKHNNTTQYVRTIDDVFAARQGYCVELTAAFASWAHDIGLNVGILLIPGHMYPFIVGLNEGEAYGWDPNLLCYTDYPDLSSPSAENFKLAKDNFDRVLERSMEEYTKDIAEIQANTYGYQLVMLRNTRDYIPSLNISESYWEKQSRSVGEQGLMLVDHSKWNKFSSKFVPVYK